MGQHWAMTHEYEHIELAGRSTSRLDPHPSWFSCCCCCGCCRLRTSTLPRRNAKASSSNLVCQTMSDPFSAHSHGAQMCRKKRNIVTEAEAHEPPRGAAEPGVRIGQFSPSSKKKYIRSCTRFLGLEEVFRFCPCSQVPCFASGPRVQGSST